jgi:hypothetical protein
MSREEMLRRFLDLYVPATDRQSASSVLELLVSTLETRARRDELIDYRNSMNAASKDGQRPER